MALTDTAIRNAKPKEKPHKVTDAHIAHAYVDTAFAAQGRTADHVMIHADSGATNLVDQKSFYVAISRAKESATMFTNDRDKLVSAIRRLRTGHC